MKTPPFHPDEAERLQALRDLLILDTDPEDPFDAITVFCQSRFGVRTALVSLVDENRQWFKSARGLDVRETPRDISFCGHTILGDGPLVVPDARRDQRFADNPLVTGPPHIRFYAGAPLRLENGMTVGTLCLIDPDPHTLQPEDLRDLQDLAQTVVRELERRVSRVR